MRRLLCSSNGWDFQMNTCMFDVNEPSTVDEDMTVSIKGETGNMVVVPVVVNDDDGAKHVDAIHGYDDNDDGNNNNDDDEHNNSNGMHSGDDIMIDSCSPLTTRRCSLHRLIHCHNSNVSFIFHKPIHVLCSAFDPTHNNRKPSATMRRTVYDVVQDMGFPRNLKLVGRLDADTSGIMLFTNDSGLLNCILRPLPDYVLDMIEWNRSNSMYELNEVIQTVMKLKAKQYLLGMLEGKNIVNYMGDDNIFNVEKFEIDFSQSFQFNRSGAIIPVKQSQVKLVRRYQDARYSHNKANLGWCLDVIVTISEGKHHQIRRMARRHGYHIMYLQRISLCGGLLNIESIPTFGACRWLTIDEKKSLYDGFEILRNVKS